MPMQWTLANERLLFLRVLDAYKGPMNYKWLAETWPNANERPTPRAISEHIFKLKKLAKSDINGGAADATPASTPKTPRIRKAPTPRSVADTSSRAGSKRKRDATEPTPERNFTPVNIKAELNDSLTLADLEQATPSKRSRKPAEHLNMAAYMPEDTGSDGGDSSDDPAYAPEESDFVDYEGNASGYQLLDAI
ncbi:hypothetical protein UA08_00725 [Talaromyces atroroseus]|uniref:Uncharacterized protein n=1 Tax=Talaromyces atroroseus TaxID=1441469 RepID=A0A225BDR8_TALAT|nr:hypothetical protein UA08_00725 [Talaromyces atroroseus]OKL64167.1 hypothetical protein UA08_00725 [Talaromyces atroroseus]